MAFIEDLYHDEIRSGWIVRSDIKKAWEKMLELWQELDRICRKYGINYWAYCGTLLGSARHKGFIPWDTDMDLCMMRPEYNIFCDAVERELINEDGRFEIGQKRLNNFRVSLSTTTMLGEEDLHKRDESKPYGMMIEVYPLDVAPDGTTASDLAVAKLMELLSCANKSGYSHLVELANNNKRIYNEWTILEKFHVLSERAMQDFYNGYSAMLFKQSSAVGWIDDRLKAPHKIYPKDIFRETIYLPFESVQMPAPVDYEKILATLYGDWHKLVYDRTFRIGSIYSPDIPYREFLKTVDLEFMFPPEDTP